jgi:hypothetical protein
MLCSSFYSTPGLPCRDERLIHRSAFASRATVAKSHVIATALLQLVLLKPTRADDVKSDDCGLASVFQP